MKSYLLKEFGFQGEWRVEWGEYPGRGPELLRGH